MVASLPLLMVEVPPLFDYPNHLARMGLLRDLPGSDPLQRYYEIRWRPLPNLGMDLLVPTLARVLPLAAAGKVFIVAVFGVLAAGTALLQRAATGRWSIWPLFAFLLLYSRVLLWGFLNYLLGVGLALVAAAVWIAMAQRNALARVLLSSALALALFFSHLMACAVYAVIVAGYELGAAWRARLGSPGPAIARLVLAGLPFLPPLAILLLAGEGGGLGAISYGSVVRKVDLLFSIFDNYDRIFDVACFAIVVVGAGYAFARRRLVIVPALRWPLALLALVYLATPSQLMTASAVDHRLPLVIGLVLAAATSAPKLAPRTVRAVALAGLALFLSRMGVIAVEWHRADAADERYIAILDRVPVGSRLAVAFPSGAIHSDPVPKTHLPTLAIIRRQAFVPTLFAFRGQQPLAFTPEAQRLVDLAQPNQLWLTLTGGGADRAAALATIREFDMLVVLDRKPFTLAPMPGLTPIAIEPDFALFRIDH